MPNPITKFLRLESAGGIILILMALLAMTLANSPLSGYYQQFLDLDVQLKIGALDLHKPLLLWINDGLMAIFFLVIGLEVKREMIDGALSTRAQATFPAIAALGGMLAPALIYLLVNHGDPATHSGWAIPAATDIAFALGVMALLGNRVPTSLKVFLLALAIIDDLGVILIIALFYTSELSLSALGVAVGAVALLFWMNRRGVDRLSFYLIVGAVLWVAVLKSGVHATLAGVIIGFMIPYKGKRYSSPLKHLEHKLHGWCVYFILPIFAFANAGVSLAGISLASLASPVPLGVMLGLCVGKPVGITLVSYLALKFKLAKLPEGTHFGQIMAVSVLCGIGFTMSMFIASLAFSADSQHFDTLSRLGILCGSTLAAVSGYLILRATLPVVRLSPIQVTHG